MSALPRPTPAATARLKTGGDCLRFANKLFKAGGIAHGQGFVTAEEESLTLMGHATGLAWERLPACFDRPLTTKEKTAFLGLVERRVFDRVPTGYLVGEAWLGGLRFRVGTITPCRKRWSNASERGTLQRRRPIPARC